MSIIERIKFWLWWYCYVPGEWLFPPWKPDVNEKEEPNE